MGGVRSVRVVAGTRIGFWKVDNYSFNGSPFDCLGYYTGPDLGDHIPGTRLQQNLMEGELIFQVGVLFRPDLSKRQRLETILILVKYIPEMFEYEHWERTG